MSFAFQKYPTKRGVPRVKLTKYGVGGSLLALLILLIWFPLLFFSFSSTFYQPNPPKEVTVEIKLGGYLVGEYRWLVHLRSYRFFKPLYQMTAQDVDLRAFTNDDSKNLRNTIDALAASPALKVNLSFLPLTRCR